MLCQFLEEWQETTFGICVSSKKFNAFYLAERKNVFGSIGWYRQNCIFQEERKKCLAMAEYSEEN